MTKAGELINRARSLGARLWVDGQKVELDVPSDFPPDLIELLRTNKGLVLEALAGGKPEGNGLQHGGQGSRVYQEYMELLGETKELGPENDPRAVSPVLDVNLIASLTRWAVIAKQRVDGQKLNQILDLYAQLGHLTPNLRVLLTQIIDLVDEDPLDVVPLPAGPELEALPDVGHSKVDADAQNSIDLIFHLHGVLAGSLAIRPVTTPKVANPIA